MDTLFAFPRVSPESPKLLEFQVIKAKTACDINQMWHSRLPIIDWSNVVRNTHYVCFAGYFSDNVFAVTIWSSPVAQNRFAHGKQVLELRRMAVAPDAPRNTATRMLAHNRKWIKENFPDIALLVSYQDTEVHLGTIYKADNWVAASVSTGLKWDNGNRKRNKEQSLADKVRWEYKLHDFIEVDSSDDVLDESLPLFDLGS